MSRVVYQSASSAEAAAVRQLDAGKPGVIVMRAPLLSRVWRVKGGDGLQVVPLADGWGLESIPAAQLNDRVRWAAIDDCLARAAVARTRALELVGSSFAARHAKEAERLDLRAAALLDGTEPITSSERDNREERVA